MSFETLLVQTCTVKHLGETGTDRYGNPEIGVLSEDAGVKTRIDQASAAEILLDRDSASAQFVAFFMPSQTITAFDLVETDEDTFRVVGPPWKVYDSTGVHHIEAQLESISDLDWTYP